MKKETKRSWLTALCALATLASGYLLSCANGDMTLTLDQAQATTTETSDDKVIILAPAAAGTVTLYKNGDSQGVKESIAAALAAIPQTGSDEYVITLARGTYKENGLTYKGSNSVKISGLGIKKYGTDVLIYGQGTDMSQESTRSTLSFQGAAQVVLENLTVQNSYGMTTGTAQAEALGLGPTAFTGTLAAYNCAFLSGQDTICTEGKAWFYQCYVEGDVDFLWMEDKSGVVALYEECVLHAIAGRTETAYFTAPRLEKTSKVGKGLVLYNSTLRADNDLTAVYLGRNPWNSSSYYTSYYEQVAVVGCTYEGKLTDLWYTKSGRTVPEANGTTDQTLIGFKTDSYFASYANAGEGGTLTDAQVAAEYAGRNNILNRYYDTNSGKFKADAENTWDVSELESAWGIAADTSKATNDGETVVKSTTYDFVGELAVADSGTDAAGSADGISWTGLSNSGNKEWKEARNSATVTFSVAEASVVALTAYQNGVGKLTATVGGTAVVDDSSACGTTAFLTSGAGEVVITFTGQTYFSKITVSTRTDEVNKVSAVAVALDDTQIAKTESTAAKATITPYYLNNKGSDAVTTAVTWSSSDTGKATIDAGTGAISGVAAGTTDITATCGGVSGKATLTVTETATTKLSSVKWDWTSNSVKYYSDVAMATEVSGGLQDTGTKIGYIKGSSDKLLAYVDASVSQGKLGFQTGYAQINSGTKIQIPVSAGSVVTVVAYSGQAKWTVGGCEQTTNTAVMTASATGYIELVATGGYINAIQVTNVDYTEAHSSPVTVSAFDSTSSATALE